MNIERQKLASDLRSAIQYFTDLTIEEQLKQKVNPDADKAWDNVIRLIDKLAEG